MRFPPAPRILLALGLLLLGGILLARLGRERPAGRVAPGPGEPAAQAPQGFLRLGDGKLPNVLLLTVDTLRADHVSIDDRSFAGLTPSLERLAARGTVFLNTSAAAPATRPALAGLHSGAYVHLHRVASNHSVMPPGVPLLAQSLKRSGYTTAAFFGNLVLKPVSGFARGFKTYQSYVRPTGVTLDQDGVDMVLAWLASAPKEPWFLWLHLMDPHGPYNSAPRSPLAAEVVDPLPDVELVPSKSNYGLGPIIPKYQIMLIPPRAAGYRRRYRDEVIFVDAQIERVLARLEELGRRDATVVVFTADHGEGLGEHDFYFQHGWQPYEPSVHVPMIWSLPGRIAEGHRVSATNSHVDVVPTLLAGLGLPPPPVDGRNLGAALTGGEPADGSAFILTAYLNQVTAVRRGTWKVVHTPPPPRPLPRDSWHDFYPEAESWQLYDLDRDPGETTDLSAEEPERFAELRGELSAWERQNGVPTGTRGIPQVDGESRARLRALGYAD